MHFHFLNIIGYFLGETNTTVISMCHFTDPYWYISILERKMNFLNLSHHASLVQVWQCGGSMEVLPCARVAHIERTKKPYNNDIDYYAKRNALRAAEVWMDEYKSHVYMAWNIPMNVRAPSPSSSLPPSPARIAFFHPAHSLACSCRRAAPPALPRQQSIEKFEIQISSHLTFTAAVAQRRGAGAHHLFQTDKGGAAGEEDERSLPA